MKVYGIKNCDTVKKALVWLENNKIEFEFIDFKKKPATEFILKKWLESTTWKELINTRGTTYRKLTEEQKGSLMNDSAAIDIMMENNSIIKRPIIEFKDKLVLGFDASKYESTFK